MELCRLGVSGGWLLGGLPAMVCTADRYCRAGSGTNIGRVRSVVTGSCCMGCPAPHAMKLTVCMQHAVTAKLAHRELLREERVAAAHEWSEECVWWGGGEGGWEGGDRPGWRHSVAACWLPPDCCCVHHHSLGQDPHRVAVDVHLVTELDHHAVVKLVPPVATPGGDVGAGNGAW